MAPPCQACETRPTTAACAAAGPARCGAAPAAPGAPAQKATRPTISLETSILLRCQHTLDHSIHRQTPSASKHSGVPVARVRQRARLAAEREDGDGAAVAGAAAGAPGAANILRRIAREVKQHYMVHVRTAQSRGMRLKISCMVSRYAQPHSVPGVDTAKGHQ